MLILSAEQVEPIGADYRQAMRIQYQCKVFERLCSFGVHQRQQAIKECQKYLDSHTRGSVDCDISNLCSTPYGIKGIGTAVAGTPSQSGTVEENTSTSWTWTIFPATYC